MDVNPWGRNLQVFILHLSLKDQMGEVSDTREREISPEVSVISNKYFKVFEAFLWLNTNLTLFKRFHLVNPFHLVL